MVWLFVLLCEKNRSLLLRTRILLEEELREILNSYTQDEMFIAECVRLDEI